MSHERQEATIDAPAVQRLAQRAGLRFIAGAIDGTLDDLVRFARAVEAEVEARVFQDMELATRELLCRP